MTYDIQSCKQCRRRYHSGANPDPAYLGYCGICRPRIDASAYAGAIEANEFRMASLVEQGLRRDNAGPSRYLPDEPVAAWEELEA